MFSIIRTLDYPDFLLRSQRVRIIEVRLYLFSPCLLIYLLFSNHVLVDVIIIGIILVFSATFLNVGLTTFSDIFKCRCRCRCRHYHYYVDYLHDGRFSKCFLFSNISSFPERLFGQNYSNVESTLF